jgi:predicted nucleic acid-binding protein
MTIFIDTSAFFAILDRDDLNHHKAKKSWHDLLNSENTLVTSNYIVVECFAIMQHRLGLEAIRGFQEDLLPLINIEWIKPETHNSGISALFAAGRRKLSLVDCTSFEIMRSLGIKTAFVFDVHFAEQGFKCLP